MKRITIFMSLGLFLTVMSSTLSASDKQLKLHELYSHAIAGLLEFNLNGYDVAVMPHSAKSRKVKIVKKRLDITEHCFYYLSALRASKQKKDLSPLQQQYLDSMQIINVKKLTENSAEISEFAHINDFGPDHIRNLGLCNFSVLTIKADESHRKSLSKAHSTKKIIFIGEGVHCKMSNAAWDKELKKIDL